MTEECIGEGKLAFLFMSHFPSRMLTGGAPSCMLVAGYRFSGVTHGTPPRAGGGRYKVPAVS